MNFNIKTKIKINSVEYASVDEMPDDIRQLYEKAMQGNTQKTTTKIKFNGVEYSRVEDMPLEVQKMYHAVMGVVEAPPQMANPTPEQSQQIANALSAGNKIEAINLYRSATGSDLMHSKEFIEKLAVTLHESDPVKYPLKPIGKGCLGLVLVLVALVIIEMWRMC